jgi:superfamily II DNA or RNA helicase
MQSVTIIVSNYLTIDIAQLSTKAEAELVRYLTYKNPEKAMKRNMGVWAGNVADNLFLFRRFEEGGTKYLLIDRGCYKTVATVLGWNGYSIVMKDKRVGAPITIPPHIITLEPYQQDALDNVIGKKHQGIIVFPTGTGKTVTAIALTAKLSHRTLILVHTTDLLDQWKRSLAKFIPGVGVDHYAGEHKKIGEHYTIATVQTMAKGIPEEVIMQFGTIVLDECHHVAATTFQDTVGQFPAMHRYGLTATPKRRDGKNFFITSAFGDVLAQIEYEDAGDRIIMPTIFPIKTKLSSDYSQIYVDRGAVGPVLNYTYVYNIFASDADRNKIILDLVHMALQVPKSHVLILTKRRENAISLKEYLVPMGVPTEALLGGGTSKYKKEKAEAIQQTLAGNIQVLTGTSVADEGLDIINLNTLILASPSSWYGILQQRIGRIMRNHQGKETPNVYDLVDADIPEFLESWKVRERFLKSKGFKIDYSLIDKFT